MRSEPFKIGLLSPHRDDAAFSCGILLMALLASEIEVDIINVCTESNYAPYLEVHDAARVEQITRARKAEDDNFGNLLARYADAPRDRLHFIDLGWQDAPLRLACADEEVLTTSVESSERRLLATQLEQYASSSLMIAPAGIGGHVDHLLVRAAAEEVFSGKRLLFYEDLPYACRHAELQSRMVSGLAEWRSPRAFSPVAKRDFSRCYPSQIASDVADEMQQYANELGGRERFFGDPHAVRAINAALHQQGVPLDLDSTIQLTT